jgi:hypothetical protein
VASKYEVPPPVILIKLVVVEFLAMLDVDGQMLGDYGSDILALDPVPIPIVASPSKSILGLGSCTFLPLGRDAVGAELPFMVSLSTKGKEVKPSETQEKEDGLAGAGYGDF